MDKPSSCSSHKYAVVQFDNLDFSVVPVIWLDEPHHCYWPTGIKNVRTAIVKEMSVKDNFMKYKCQIFSKHDTYESALEAEKQIVATSESEEAESRMGKRKVKNNKYDDYVSFPNPPRLLLSKESHKSVSRHTNKDNENSKLNNSQDINDNILTEYNIDNVPITIYNENTNTDFDFTQDLKTILSNIETQIKNIKETQSLQEQSLSEIKETTKLILAKINSEQYGKEYSMLKDDKIKQKFPLTSIQNLLDFDDILKDDQEAFMQVVNKILQIGGKNEKDFVRRALAVTFDDNLACMCSWTGQKNNFKIGDTHIMLSIKKAFKATFPRSTEKDLEQLVMEWFRFANVRKQKKERKEK